MYMVNKDRKRGRKQSRTSVALGMDGMTVWRDLSGTKKIIKNRERERARERGKERGREKKARH